MAHKILIIDDEEGIRDLVYEVLYDEDREFLFAENGKEGLQEFFKGKPDLIILDMQMPVMGGMEFLEELQPHQEDLFSVIVMTAHGDRETIKKCFSLGINAFIQKPFNHHVLKGTVRNALMVKTLQRSYHDEIVKTSKAAQELKKEIALRKTHEEEKKGLYRMLTHDIKSPLTNIKTNISMIKDFGEINEMQNEAMDISLECVNEILDMVITILDISRNEGVSDETHGKERVEISTSVNKIVRHHKGQVREKGLCFEEDYIQEKLYVMADPLTFHRAIDNLLSNAIKYTDEGTISVSVSKEPDNHDPKQSLGIISISDTGVGMTEDVLKEIFKPFYRSDGMPNKDSFGIGLSSCKSIVERHEGRISVVSELGKGSTFSIRLPLVDLKEEA